MKQDAYRIVSEAIKIPTNVILTGAGAGKGAITGHFTGRKIGQKKYRNKLQTTKLNFNKAKEEAKSDSSKLQNVELLKQHLTDLETPEAKKKYVNRYTRAGELGGSLTGAATGVLAHKAGISAYKRFRK